MLVECHGMHAADAHLGRAQVGRVKTHARAPRIARQSDNQRARVARHAERADDHGAQSRSRVVLPADNQRCAVRTRMRTRTRTRTRTRMPACAKAIC